MLGLRRKFAEEAPPAEAPVLDLSGPRLRRAFENLVQSARPTGGVERYVTALMLKASLFEELIGGGASELTETEFLDLCAFISPVRRRIGGALAAQGFDAVRSAVRALVAGIEDARVADERLAGFVAAFPADKAHRWTRDLGAEILHFTRPDLYPLMARWVWDERTGTGVLREIWHADDVDAARICASNGIITFRTLVSELDGFLAGEGVFRDRCWYVDLLMAHVYAAYINDRGGQYLRTDFTLEGDPMLHTRRMLGLDAVDTDTGRTKLRLIDGAAHHFGGALALTLEEAGDADS